MERATVWSKSHKFIKKKTEEIAKNIQQNNLQGFATVSFISSQCPLFCFQLLLPRKTCGAYVYFFKTSSVHRGNSEVKRNQILKVFITLGKSELTPM